MKRVAVILGIVAASACSNNGTTTTPTPGSGTATKIIGLGGNLAFGNVPVGQSVSATLTIANSGNSALTVTSLSVSGGLSAVTAASWTNGAIAAGASQQVTVQFTPAAAQAYSGTLAVNGDQTSGTNTIAISGTGIAKASFAVTGTGLYQCVTGLCSSFTYPITNNGPGCATNVSVITRFFGANGSGPQLGIDVPMFAPGQNLATILFRPGATVQLQNTVSFNDIRSAATVFRAFFTWNDVPCS